MFNEINEVLEELRSIPIEGECIECELPPLVEVDGFVVNIPKTEQVYPRYQGHSNL